MGQWCKATKVRAREQLKSDQMLIINIRVMLKVVTQRHVLT